jgi:hypothetical protein
MVDQIFGNNDWIYNFNFDGTETYIIKGAQQIFDKTNKNNVFLCSYSGMGCYHFARRKTQNDDIEVFFMHGDAWGQYGIESSDVNEMNNFVLNYDIVKANEVLYCA